MAGKTIEHIEKYRVKWGAYRLGEIFDLSAIKQAKSQSLIPDDAKGIPYVVQSTKNNMVARAVSKEWLLENGEGPYPGNAIALGVTLPAVSYQDQEFGASQIIVARSEDMSSLSGPYIATVIAKHMSRFSYANKPGMKIYSVLEILLPQKNDKTPNWLYMEKYVRAIEKLTIKDVVNWKDKEIETIKYLVG